MNLSLVVLLIATGLAGTIVLVHYLRDHFSDSGSDNITATVVADDSSSASTTTTTSTTSNNIGWGWWVTGGGILLLVLVTIAWWGGREALSPSTKKEVGVVAPAGCPENCVVLPYSGPDSGGWYTLRLTPSSVPGLEEGDLVILSNALQAEAKDHGKITHFPNGNDSIPVASFGKFYIKPEGAMPTNLWVWAQKR